MAFLSSLNIPLSGLTAERFRMDIIAQNITNANDVATTPDEVYKRQLVVYGEDKTFKNILRTKLGSGEIWHNKYIKYRGVQAMQVVEDPTPAEPVYNPRHPLADELGYVYESNVDRAVEEMDAIQASDSYNAIANVYDVVLAMANKGLTIGKS